MAVNFIPQTQVEYPRNALLDFSPVVSAMENADQQDRIARQFAFQQQQMGMQQERLGFERALHPGALRLQGLQGDTATESLNQARLVNPLALRQQAATTVSAEDTLRAMQGYRNGDGTAAVNGGIARANGPLPVTGLSPTAPATAPAMTPAAPPLTQTSPSVQPMPGIAVPPPRQTSTTPAPPANQPDFDAIGGRFIQEHILNHPAGESRFAQMMLDPFFQDAARQHGLHEMNWRQAAQSMAGSNDMPGVTVTPAAANPPPASQPNAPPATVPTPPPAQQAAPSAPQTDPASAQRFPASAGLVQQLNEASRMIRTGIPDLVTNGRGMQDSIVKTLLERGMEVNRDGQGNWWLQPVAGFAESTAALERAKRLGTAPVEILVGAAQQSGRPIAVTPGQSVATGGQIDPNQAAAADWAARQLGILPGGTPGQAPPASNGPAPQTTPAPAAVAPPAANSQPVPQPGPQYGPQAVSAPQTPAQTPPLSSLTPFPTGLRRNPDGSVSTIQTGEHAELQKQLAERFNELRSSAEGAGVTQQRLASMEDAFRRLNANPGILNTGAGAALRQNIAEVLSTISTSMGGQPIAADRIADLQQLNKEMVTLGFAVARSVGGNRVLASEVTAAMRGVPTPSNSAQGALTVLNLLKQSSQHDIDQYRFTQNWLLQHGTTFGADTAFMQQNPPQMYVARGLNQARYSISDNDLASLQANRSDPQAVANFDAMVLSRRGPAGLSRLYLQNGPPPPEFMPGGVRQAAASHARPELAPGAEPPAQQSQTTPAPQQAPAQQPATPWQPPARPPGPQQARYEAQQAIAREPTARAEVVRRMRQMGYSVWGL